MKPHAHRAASPPLISSAVHARAHAPSPSDGRFGLILSTCLTPIALLVGGYHPYGEDGGLYAAGIKRLLRPELYTHDAAFVEAHLRFSQFAPMIAALVRISHLSLPAVLLLVHLATLGAMLFATWLVAGRCFAARTARAGAVTLMAAWMTLPVAGTALLLMDPYLTARSIALPCTLFALVGLYDYLGGLSSAATLSSEKGLTQDRHPERSAAESKDLRFSPSRLGQPMAVLLMSLTVTAFMHPLMGTYALGYILLLRALLARSKGIRIRATTTLCIAAFVGAAAIQATAPPETTDYIRVAVTRYYWFLSRWQWYELLGLAAPLMLIPLLSRLHPSSDAARALAAMATAAGWTAIAVALAFAHRTSATHLVARLQPLRVFQIVYVILIVLLGGVLGERVFKRSGLRWGAAFVLLACGLFAAARNTYPSSAHIEWPGARPQNPWAQAFLWISRNTPVDALFALDANYISAPHEDAQVFRAFAERSALPDYSKDGGEASITPALTPAWIVGQQAQTSLSLRSDTDRLALLRPLGVTWIVLQGRARTDFLCPFANAAVQVCRLP